MTVKQRLETGSTDRDLAVVISKLEAHFGALNRPPAQLRQLRDDWQDMLGSYDPVTLHEAANAHIKTGKKFPLISEMLALCQEEKRGLLVGTRRRMAPELEHELRTWRPPTDADRQKVQAIAANLRQRLTGSSTWTGAPHG